MRAVGMVFVWELLHALHYLNCLQSGMIIDAPSRHVAYSFVLSIVCGIFCGLYLQTISMLIFLVICLILIHLIAISLSDSISINVVEFEFIMTAMVGFFLSGTATSAVAFLFRLLYCTNFVFLISSGLSVFASFCIYFQTKSK